MIEVARAKMWDDPTTGAVPPADAPAAPAPEAPPAPPPVDPAEAEAVAPLAPVAEAVAPLAPVGEAIVAAVMPAPKPPPIPAANPPPVPPVPPVVTPKPPPVVAPKPPPVPKLPPFVFPPVKPMPPKIKIFMPPIPKPPPLPKLPPVKMPKLPPIKMPPITPEMIIIKLFRIMQMALDMVDPLRHIKNPLQDFIEMLGLHGILFVFDKLRWLKLQNWKRGKREKGHRRHSKREEGLARINAQRAITEPPEDLKEFIRKSREKVEREGTAIHYHMSSELEHQLSRHPEQINKAAAMVDEILRTYRDRADKEGGRESAAATASIEEELPKPMEEQDFDGLTDEDLRDLEEEKAKQKQREDEFAESVKDMVYVTEFPTPYPTQPTSEPTLLRDTRAEREAQIEMEKKKRMRNEELAKQSDERRRQEEAEKREQKRRKSVVSEDIDRGAGQAASASDREKIWKKTHPKITSHKPSPYWSPGTEWGEIQEALESGYDKLAWKPKKRDKIYTPGPRGDLDIDRDKAKDGGVKRVKIVYGKEVVLLYPTPAPTFPPEPEKPKIPWRYETSPALPYPEIDMSELREATVCSSLLTLLGCDHAKNNSAFYETHIMRPSYIVSLSQSVKRYPLCVDGHCPTTDVMCKF